MATKPTNQLRQIYEIRGGVIDIKILTESGLSVEEIEAFEGVSRRLKHMSTPVLLSPQRCGLSGWRLKPEPRSSKAEGCPIEAAMARMPCAVRTVYGSLLPGR